MSAGAERAWIALGSNLGDRRAVIEGAVEDLGSADGVGVLSVSTLVETDAVGPPGQPRYLNGAAAVSTTLEPRRLLDVMLAIEASRGRDRGSGNRWEPRTLDLDLLLYDDLVIKEPGLVVPHPRMHRRAFVLGPMVEIAPSVWHPELERSIQSLWERLEAGAPVE